MKLDKERSGDMGEGGKGELRKVVWKWGRAYGLKVLTE